jgi:hypothetical protein
MAKKADRPPSKKECPSCGLGVPQDASICEFCGWDFEEEDEWILQIEKLERDLMLEKQRYEPGTVNHMIESTLHSPLLERTVKSVPASEDVIEAEPVEEPLPVEEFEEEAPSSMAAPPEEPEVVEAPEERPKVRRVRASAAPPSVEEVVEEPPPEPVKSIPVRRVKPSPPPAEDAPRTRKVRTVRKVKG